MKTVTQYKMVLAAIVFLFFAGITRHANAQSPGRTDMIVVCGAKGSKITKRPGTAATLKLEKGIKVKERGVGEKHAVIKVPIVLKEAEHKIYVPPNSVDLNKERLRIEEKVSGQGGMSKEGAGRMVLYNDNSFKGQLDIKEGGVMLKKVSVDDIGNPLGDPSGATIVRAGAFLDLKGVNILAKEPLTLNGTGVSGKGALINDSSAAVLFKGSIALESDAKIAALKGEMKFTGDGDVTGAHKLELECTKAIVMDCPIKTLAAPVEKKGADMLTLSGKNTYTGVTHIYQGKVRLKHSPGREDGNPLGSPEGGTIIEEGAVLDLNGVSILTEEPLTLKGSGIEGEGALINDSTATAEYLGLLKLEKAAKIAAIKGDLILSNQGEITGEFELKLECKKKMTVKSAFAIAAAPIEKTGPATLELEGNSSFTGPLKVKEGKLKILDPGDENSGPLGSPSGETIISDGAVLDLNGFAVLAAEPLKLSGEGTSGEGALINSSTAPAEFNGIIILEGDTKINADMGDISLTNPAPITGNFGLALDGENNINIVSDIETGDAPVDKYGTGTWTLSGDNTFTGPLTVFEGAIQLGSDECLDDNSPVVLDGGTLITGETAGFNEIAGTLQVGEASAAIKLAEEPHVLAFKKSAAEPWAPSAKLEVKGWKGPIDGTSGYEGQIFFGDDETGLTPAQVEKIHFKKEITELPAKIMVTGELVATGNWLGLEDEDWFNPLNWYKNIIPDPDIDAVISSFAFNQPRIDIPGAVCHDLIINNGASLIISSDISLSVHGNWINNGNLTLDNSTVIFEGDHVQSIGGNVATDFYNIVLNNTFGAELTNNQSVTGTLTLLDGLLVLGAYNLTLGEAAVEGTPGPASMIVATSTGECRRIFRTTGAYTFPVGDATAITEYSPITLNFTIGTFSNAYAEVRVINAKHPCNASMVNYLTRYWSVSSAGISDFLCDVSGNYVPADIVGEESAQVAGKYSGSLPWTKYSPLAGNTLTANGIDSFSDFTGITLAPPTVSISADPGFLVCKDDELNLTAVPIGDLSFTYLWSPGGAMTQTISPSTASPGTSLFMVEVTDGNGFTSTSSVSIGVNSINLTGTLKYNNADQTVLSGVELTILPSGVNISSTTDADGIYTFTGLCPGNYTIEVTGIDKEVGYINSTDAAQINAWAVSGLPIERVKWMSGDVTYSGAVNSTDAKAVQNFFVYFWPFTRGEWTFWKAGQMVNSGDMNVEIPVNLSGNLELNLYGQAVGDFNGSFTPGGLKAASATLDLAYGETRLAGAAVEVELPVRMVNAGEIGAASLILNYPAELFEVTGVSMKLEIGNLDWNAKGGELRIGWNSLIPLQLEANSLWLTITGRTTESFGEGDEIRLALAPDPLNELADGSFNVIPDAKLQIDVLAFSTTGTSDNGQWTMDNGQLKFSSQPNPFANFTTLVYTLPAEGFVTLEITDLLGRRVALLVDEWKTKGEYSLKLDATPLQPGVYMATLRLETREGDFATSIKLIRNR